MEKKVTKKFYFLSAINIIPAIILGWGNVMDIAVLVVILLALMVNHTIIVKIIGTLASSLAGDENNGSPTKRLLGLMFLKMMLLGGVLVLSYFYNPTLVPKVLVLMIFQLIIQVVSIKNNY